MNVILHLEPVCVRAEDAAAAMGVSRDFFDKEIAPEIACARRGRLRLYSVESLREWARANSTRVTDDLGLS